ncbi:hypothetical protein AVEN_52123-1 [Araneus ventricosus]|uniref:Uncharacterized protein n=1 Tax=Araneus ventricosus TaxID=182803 RepID=A0A4Y2E6K3_ARAVE|nr:hypothetical protein AVEN_52123-1 [Araneus ventricosus]
MMDIFRFWDRISTYMLPVILPSIITISATPLEEKHPHTITSPPQCFTLCRIFIILRASPDRSHTLLRFVDPKRSYLLFYNNKTLSQNWESLEICSFAKAKRFEMFYFVKYGLFLWIRLINPGFSILRRTFRVDTFNFKSFAVSLDDISFFFCASLIIIESSRALVFGFLPRPLLV